MENFIQNFYDLFEDSDRSLFNADTQFKNLDEWDSMIALMLIAMFDEKYQIKLNGDAIKKASTISDLFELTRN